MSRKEKGGISILYHTQQRISCINRDQIKHWKTAIEPIGDIEKVQYLLWILITPASPIVMCRTTFAVGKAWRLCQSESICLVGHSWLTPIRLNIWNYLRLPDGYYSGGWLTLPMRDFHPLELTTLLSHPLLLFFLTRWQCYFSYHPLLPV